MITLKDAKDRSTIGNIAGAATNSAEFIRFINEAQQRLLARGDWPGTVIPIHVCVRNGCVVWPRFVKQVRALTDCGKHVHVRGLWYDFLEYRSYLTCCATNSCCGASNMTFIAHVPTVEDIYGDGWFVVVYRQATADDGKTVRLFGVDNYDQPLRTNNGDGTWSEGIALTLGNPYAITAIAIRRIDRVVKDVTQGRVFMYAVYGPSYAEAVANIAANNQIVLLGQYDPSETSPDYMRYRLNIRTCCQTDNCGDRRGVVALVKIKHIPVAVDNDWIMIDNLAALKDMIQSIKFREAGSPADARAYEADAIRELNLDSADELPEWQTPTMIEPFSHTHIGSQRMY